MSGKLEFIVGAAFVVLAFLGAWCMAAGIASFAGCSFPDADWIGCAGPVLLAAGLGIISPSRAAPSEGSNQ